MFNLPSPWPAFSVSRNQCYILSRIFATFSQSACSSSTRTLVWRAVFLDGTTSEVRNHLSHTWFTEEECRSAWNIKRSLFSSWSCLPEGKVLHYIDFAATCLIPMAINILRVVTDVACCVQSAWCQRYNVELHYFVVFLLLLHISFIFGRHIYHRLTSYVHV